MAQLIFGDTEIPSSLAELLIEKYGRGNPKSDIIGIGWGMSHEWSQIGHQQWSYTDPFTGVTKGGNNIGGPTFYRCSVCRVRFDHHYHDIPDIFEAMKEAGIPDECEGKGHA